MSVNKYEKHLLVFPEDRANAEIAKGFLLNLKLQSRVIQINRPSGGWLVVIADFLAIAPTLNTYPDRHVVLLIDFDGKFEERSQHVFSQIPEDTRSRVFLLGTEDEPEKLKTELRCSFEEIGKRLSSACFDNAPNSLWQNQHLQHNQNELTRLENSVKSFVFK